MRFPLLAGLVSMVCLTACEPSGPCGAKGQTLEIASTVAWANLVAARCTEFRGGLLVNIPDAGELSPPADTITTISGDLGVAYSHLERFSLPSLTRIDGALSVSFNPTLTSLSLPALSSVGQIELKNDAKLDTLSLPSLTTASNLTLIMDDPLSTPGLITVSLPSLTTLTDSVYVTGNQALNTLDLPRLTTVKGDLAIFDNSGLRQCVVTALRDQLTSGPRSFTATGNGGMPNTCP